MPIKVTDADVETNVKKYPLMVVECWAPWWRPCRMVGPIIEELAKEMQGKIVFGKLNVDENRATSAKHGIMSIPTLLVFKSGNLVDNIIGAMPKEMLLGKISILFSSLFHSCLQLIYIKLSNHIVTR
ncbi:MAG: thioredoxin [Promethearchaeota archaeon]